MTEPRNRAHLMAPAPSLRRTFFSLTAGLACLCATMASAGAAQRTIPITVDGVRISYPAFVADGVVLSSVRGEATQETTVVDRARHRAFSIIGVPFGMRAGTENALPVAHHGEAAVYRNALYDFRMRNGEFAGDAPPLALFGTLVGGDLSQRHEQITDAAGHDLDRDVFTAEWAGEAGPRLWIVRVTQDVPVDRPLTAFADFAGSVHGMFISSDGSIRTATSVFPDVLSAPSLRQASSLAPSVQAPPPTYSDPCDATNFNRATNRSDWRHVLGASYRGVPACGPRPATSGVMVPAALYGGAPVPVMQFDAVEFSLRWLYLAYGTPPFTTNGDTLVENYDPLAGGKPLSTFANGVHSGALPVPGDVLSYNTGGTGGHTSVVDLVQVDARGNGWVRVVEQNATVHGARWLRVIDGEILSNYGGAVLGWLSGRPYR